MEKKNYLHKVDFCSCCVWNCKWFPTYLDTTNKKVEKLTVNRAHQYHHSGVPNSGK